jgi:hypothetical protein
MSVGLDSKFRGQHTHLVLMVLFLRIMDCVWEMLLCNLSVMKDCEVRVFWNKIRRKLFVPYGRDVVVADITPSPLEDCGLDSQHY